MKKIRWRAPAEPGKCTCPDTWYSTGEWIPTTTGQYPAEYDVELFFPPSGQPFEFLRNEEWMEARFTDHKWWSRCTTRTYIYRAQINSAPQDGRKGREQLELLGEHLM